MIIGVKWIIGVILEEWKIGMDYYSINMISYIWFQSYSFDYCFQFSIFFNFMVLIVMLGLLSTFKYTTKSFQLFYLAMLIYLHYFKSNSIELTVLPFPYTYEQTISDVSHSLKNEKEKVKTFSLKRLLTFRKLQSPIIFGK